MPRCSSEKVKHSFQIAEDTLLIFKYHAKMMGKNIGDSADEALNMFVAKYAPLVKDIERLKKKKRG